MLRRWTTALCLAIATLVPRPAVAQGALPTGSAPIAFNYGYPTVDHVNIYVAQDLGLFEKAGLRPKFFTFQSGAPLLAGLKSESLDVVTAGLGLAFALGQDIPLSVILWNSNDAIGEGLVVDPKSGVGSFRDIARAGKIGAATGTCAQVALYYMAKAAGADYGKLDVVNIAAPLLRNAFLSGSIDAGIAWAPYSVTLEAEGLRVVNWDPDYTPVGGLCPRMTAVRPAFLKAHPDLGHKLVEVDAAAAVAVAQTPQLAVDALMKRLGLTEAAARGTIERIYRNRPTYEQQLAPDGPYSLTAKDAGLALNLSLSLQALHETKSIVATVPAPLIEAAIDPSPLRAFAAAPK